MTDIQRHIKGIRKILYSALVDSDQYETLNPAFVVSTIRQYLPKGYGMGEGVLFRKGEQSSPIQLIAYDVPLAGGEYPAGTTEFPIEPVLFALDFRATHTLESLAATFEAVASFKQLADFREPEPRRVDDRPIGQTRQVIPKDRLPFTLIFFDRLEDVDDPIPTIVNLMQDYPHMLQPDQIDIIGQHAQFLNPLLERYPVDWSDRGWSRTPRLRKPALCYGCKRRFLRQHFFYDQLCIRCGDLSYSRRVQTVDLAGYRVLITGARVKIGYAAALRLLRAGAEVIVTSRFPRDAAQRYSQEHDFAEWAHRLHIYGLDLRQVSRLEAFVAHLEAAYSHLDAVINNAAQTVKRPPAFYAHLLPLETAPLTALPSAIRPLLAGDAEDIDHLQPSIAGQLSTGDVDPDFPPGEYDEHGQQIDNRDYNSWVMRLEEIPPAEMAEVHLVNTIAPGILTGQLKRMLQRSPHQARFVINVSAAEGRFSQYKNGYHPHTNMAKAALNMLTRTIADAYAADGIYVTSVDPGWVSDQTPRTQDYSRAAASERIPIDMVDAAARICHPIFAAITENTLLAGVLLKDYLVTDW